MNTQIKKTKTFMNWIDQHTLLPISLVIIVSGAVFWFATLSHSAQNSERKIEHLQKKISDQNKEVSIKMDYIHNAMMETNRALGRIEGKIESKMNRK